jgi:thioredoxin reductase
MEDSGSALQKHPATQSGKEMFDVIIAGGGPAGLSAALVLGRCLRHVLVCDSGHPRNARSRSLNGYLSRDGIQPADFLALGRAELTRYNVEQRAIAVRDVVRSDRGFDVILANDERVATRAVLLATGVRDHLPDIPGLDECYGISAHHCPYCDAWEWRGRVLAAIGDPVSPAGLALSLRTWSNHLMACTNGGATVTPSQRRQLGRHHITLYESRILRLDHDEGRVRRVVFEDGREAACEGIFFSALQSQQCPLAAQLGCEFTSKGTVKTDHLGRSCVPGLYVVGDASRDVQFVIVAAAEGAKAGVAINQALQAERALPHVVPSTARI